MNEGKPGSNDEDVLSDLLKQAERREQPSDVARRTAYAALEKDWRSAVELHTKRRRLRLVGVAASFVLLAAILWSPLQQMNDGQNALAEPFGTVVLATSGDTYLNGSPVELSNVVLRAGDRFATGSNTRTAISPVEGGSLRLDENTTLLALAPNQLRLESGAVYVDSQGRTTDSFAILTAFGSVQHIGTRYAVRVSENALAVSVRGGRVRVARRDQTWEKRGGERLTLTQTTESSEDIRTFGPEWDWVLEAAPPPSLESPPSAHDLVVWIARESGYEIAYTSAEAEQRAQTPVRGLGPEVSPEQALEALRYLTDLQFDVDGGTLSIRQR